MVLDALALRICERHCSLPLSDEANGRNVEIALGDADVLEGPFVSKAYVTGKRKRNKTLWKFVHGIASTIFLLADLGYHSLTFQHIEYTRQVYILTM